MTLPLRERGVRALLLDIEGTTTPLAFVHDVLFPFARIHLRAHLRSHAGASDAALHQLREEWRLDAASPGAQAPAWDDGAADGAAAYIEWLMDQDRKSPGLKNLQGEIWAAGYSSGALKGEVFADVPPAFERWGRAGLAVAIYSSGSEVAQKQLFSTTEYGDLTKFLSGFFDTAVGPKIAAESYRRIAAALGRAPSEVLFVSDAVAELDAAMAAGCEALLAIRTGSAGSNAARGFGAIRSFDEIQA